MSLKQKFNWLSNARADVSHLRSIDESVIFDFKSLLQSFVGNTPYILRGFNINNPGGAISNGSAGLQVIVDSSVIWMPSEADGSFIQVPSGTANEILNSTNSNVVGSFTANTTNYVSVKFTRASDSSTNDLVSFWDVDADVEFTKTVPLGLVLNYQFVINTTGFGANSPIAIIDVDASNQVTRIVNAKDSLFRLGKGGSSPNVSYNWAYTAPTENSLSLTTSGGLDPYTGGDWEITTWKEWMDAVMTEIKAVKGSAYWYSPGSSLMPGVNLSDVFWDTSGSLVTGRGKLIHSDVTPGSLTWTSDIYIKSIFGPLTLTIPASNITLADNEVAYINLVRNFDFQPANVFTFTNGLNTVSATANVTNIVAGDWIKHEAHNFSAWAKVQSVVGTVVTLISNYIGASSNGKALKTVGSYTVLSAAPDAVPVNSNTWWFAKRDDNAISALTVETVANSGLQRTSNVATVKTTVAHGLVTGQAVTISGASDPSFDGFYDISSIVSTTEFTVYNPGSDIASATAGDGSISSTPKIYLRLGAGPGELEMGESIQLDDDVNLNIIQFIGAENETDITPPYTITPNGLSPYSFSPNNNLTEAISNITGNVNDIFTTLDKPSYDEPLTVVSGAPANDNEITGPVLSGATLALPLHSRLGDILQNYVVSKGYLQVFLNGQMLQEAIPGGWSEVGVALSSSNTIIINQDLAIGDVVTFRIGTVGGPGSGTGAPDDDFNSLASSVTADNADKILIYDASANGYRRQTRSVFLTGSGYSLAANTQSVDYLADANTDDVILVNTTGGNVTITLPPANTRNRPYYIKNIGTAANVMTIDADGSETIDNNLTVSTSTSMESLTLVSDGSQWWLV